MGIPADFEDAASAFEREAGSSASPVAMANASKVVERMAAAEAEVGRMTAILADKQKQLNYLKSVAVPEALAVSNQIGFTLAEGDYAGVGVKIEDFVSGSLPKEDEAHGRAIEWLEENDGKDMIKDTITITLTKSQHNMALDLMGRLKADGFSAVMRSDVHPQTLMAFARVRIKEGKPLEPETLGLFLGRIAKLIWPKGR